MGGSQKQSTNSSNELWGSSSTSSLPQVGGGGDLSKGAPRGPPPGLGKYRGLGNLVGSWNSTWLLLKNLTTQVGVSRANLFILIKTKKNLKDTHPVIFFVYVLPFINGLLLTGGFCFIYFFY